MTTDERSAPPARFRRAAVAALAAALPLAGCGGRAAEAPVARETGETAAAPAAAAPAADAAYRREIEDWRARRVASLTGEGGWLSVVGLAWLEPGENLCGSDPAARVALPAAAPPRVGSFEVGGGDGGSGEDGGEKPRVAFRVAAGVEGLGVAGEDGVEPVAPGGAIELASDLAPGGPTVLALDGLRFYLIDRDGRLGVRVKDAGAPARRQFAGIESYPLDPGWRIEARFERYDPPKRIPVPNILGTVSEEPSPGAVVFARGGESYRLDAVAEPGESDLFVIFGDRTNGRATYGGGRFLYTPPPDADGRVVIDFNRAYNPPCAFTEFATCPLPPPQNKLPIAVEAGEKRYAHAAH
jgi:uncharacterized protein (DUF1684 family)